MLSHVVADNHRDWDKYLPFCQLAHNSSRHTVINASPSMLLLCREMRFPFDLTLPELPGRIEPGTYAASLHTRMSEVWHQARLAMSEGKRKQKLYYDKKAKPSDLSVGDAVLYYSPRGFKKRNRKLLKRWRELYIVKKVTETNAEVQLYNDPDAEPVVIHLNNLKRYVGPVTRGESSEDIDIDLDLPATERPGSDADSESEAPDRDKPLSTNNPVEEMESSDDELERVLSDRAANSQHSEKEQNGISASKDNDEEQGHRTHTQGERSVREVTAGDQTEKPEQATPERATNYGLRRRPRQKRDPAFVYSERDSP